MVPELLVLQHLEREGPGRIADWAASRQVAMQMIRVDHGDQLPSLKHPKPAVAVVLGGPMGVNQRQEQGLEWLQQELQWLERWVSAKRPVLGICLGAQLLCVASGGYIEPLTAGNPPHPLREVGFGAISWRATASDVPWLSGTPDHQLVLHWHGDRCRLSKSAELLASSLHCPEQAFRMGEHAVGLQFHLETTPHCIKRWVEEDHDFINGAGVNQQTILSDLEQFRLTADQQATVLLNQLLDHLLAQA